MSGSRLLLIWAGLTTGSFIYQAWLAANADYRIALDRSFYQGCALLAVWLSMKLSAS